MSSDSLTAVGAPAGAVASRLFTVSTDERTASTDERTASTGPQPAPGRATRRWPRWIIRPIIIYLASRVVTVATLAVVTTISHQSILGEVDRWDSRWFIRAAATGWPSRLPYDHGHVTGSTLAFFPLFPLTIRWLSDVTGRSLLASGMTISAAAGLTAMIAIWTLVRHYADQRAADRATLLVAMFPGTVVLTSIYYPIHIVATFLRDPIANTKTGDLLFVGTVAAVIGAVVAIRARMPMPMPMLLYGLSAAGLGLVASPIGLRPRFIFLAFPLIIAVGTWLRGRGYIAVLSVSIALLAGMSAFTVRSWAVFP